MWDEWKSASNPPPHGKDVLLQETESKILYVGHYNEHTQKFIFCDFVIKVDYWTELPLPKGELKDGDL